MPQQAQQEVPVEALVNIIGEQTVEIKVLRTQLTMLSQRLQQMQPDQKAKDESEESDLNASEE